MSRKKTHEEFVLELGKVNPNIEIISQYVTTNDPIKCRCKIHNHIWSAAPNSLLRGRGCTLCGRERTVASRRITLEDFLSRLKKYEPTITYVDGHKNMSKHVNVSCNVCGYKWSPFAYTLAHKHHFGCPKCAGNAIKTTEEFKAELAEYAPFFELLSPYERAIKKVHVKCKDCGCDDWITPNKLKAGQGCKYCKESSGEKKIRHFLNDNDIGFEVQKRFDDLLGMGNGLLSYDYYLPQHNLLIEYQGVQHETPTKFHSSTDLEANAALEKQKMHDEIKKAYAKDNNIDLLEIWYYDFDKIETILQNKLVE